MSTKPAQMRAWRQRQRDGLPPAVVYRCFDDGGRLLYIGSTTLPIAERLRLHRVKHSRTGNLPWTEQVARVETDPYPTYDAALAAEEKAIQECDPPGNIRWTSRDRQRYGRGENPNAPWRARAKLSNRLTSRAQSRALSALKALYEDQYREFYEEFKAELLDTEDAAS